MKFVTMVIAQSSKMNSVSQPPKNSKIIQWKPNKDFKANPDEIEYILNIAVEIKWRKSNFHHYFKNIEAKFLENFRDTVNQSYLNDTPIPTEWINYMKFQWRMLALLRDFHDFMCGRDKKHYIRTDDCRRFLSCASRGLIDTKFSKPVHRLLCGENAPQKFIHPKFLQFNKKPQK